MVEPWLVSPGITGRELDPARPAIHLGAVHAAAALLRLAFLVLGGWSLTSVIVAIPVAAVFRVQARMERLWEETERRRSWLEASR